MADVEAAIAAALEADDADGLLAIVEGVDWLGMDAMAANRILQLVAAYGYSGRTSRYEGAVRAMLARDCPASLASCALLGDNDEAMRILDAVPGAINEIDGRGATALHHAAERGNIELTMVLCARGADVDAADETGQTPLANALHAGPWKPEPATDVVALLRRHGATVDFWTLAALGDTAELTATLAQSPTLVNDRDPKGRTALFSAARNNHLAAVAALLKAGADPNGACADGQTPLSTACLHTLSQECDAEIVRSLVRSGAEIILSAAIVLEDLDAVRAFVARDASVLAGQAHESALGYAIHAWRPAVLGVLIDAGARPDPANWGHIERIAGDNVGLVQDLKRRAGRGSATRQRPRPRPR